MLYGNTGEPLARGESYTFESIGNANELLAVLEGSVTGSAKLEVEQV